MGGCCNGKNVIAQNIFLVYRENNNLTDEKQLCRQQNKTLVVTNTFTSPSRGSGSLQVV